MPFTLSHPAAVVPLHRWLGARSVPAALVVGSVAPDLPYFVGLAALRTWSHSPAALVLFCVPVGLALTVAFERWWRTAWHALLPRALQARVSPRPVAVRAGPAAFCVLAGATTHVVWDAFTHDSGAGAQAFPVLRETLVVVLAYPLRVSNLLQHGSTAIAALALAVALRRFCAQEVPARDAPADPLGGCGRGAVLAGGALVVVASALALAVATTAWAPDLLAIRTFVGRASVGAIGLGAAWLIGYAAWFRRRFPQRHQDASGSCEAVH